MKSAILGTLGICFLMACQNSETATGEQDPVVETVQEALDSTALESYNKVQDIEDELNDLLLELENE